MANRRMFSLDVVDTDKFLDMPATSQNLYFHLGMRADDDGFVSSPKKITKLVNCGDDDLNVLISRGFIISMGEGIVVIRHWKQNNYIQSDRKKDTIYQDQLRMLTADNGVYEMDTHCIQPVSKMEAQYSIDKNRKEKDKKYSRSIAGEQGIKRTSLHGMKFYQYSDAFETFWSVYPRKSNKKKAYDAYLERVNSKDEDYRFTEHELLQCATAYVEHCENREIENQFIMLPATFLRSDSLTDWLLENQQPGEDKDLVGDDW